MSETAHVDLVELIADAVVRAHPSMPRAEARPIAADAVSECERAGRLAPAAAMRLALRHADGPVFVEDLELSLVPDEPVAWDPDGLSTSLRVLRGGRGSPAAAIEDFGEPCADADARSDARRRHLTAPSAGVAVGVAVALVLGAGQRYRNAEPARTSAASAPAVGTAAPQRRVVAEAPATRFAAKRVVVHRRRARRARVVPVSVPVVAPAPVTATPAPKATPSPTPTPARASVPVTPAPKPASPKRSSGQTWASDFTP